MAGLSATATKLLNEFISSANKQCLHPLDWDRFYTFTHFCYLYRSKATEQEIERLLIAEGFDKGSMLTLDTFPIPSSNGLHISQVAVPTTTALIGQTFLMQAMISPTTHPLGFDVTSASLFRIGTL